MGARSSSSRPRSSSGASPRWYRRQGSTGIAITVCWPPLRAAVTVLTPEAIAAQPFAPVQSTGEEPAETLHRSPARYLWAMLLARIYEAFPLTCPKCGAEMRIIAFITVAVDVRAILEHVGEPSTPPRIAPARGPPQWEEIDSGVVFLDEERFSGDPLAQPEPEYEFDQRVT